VGREAKAREDKKMVKLEIVSSQNNKHIHFLDIPLDPHSIYT